MVSPDGRDGSLTTHQDSLLYSICLEEGGSASRSVKGRRAYVQVVQGSCDLNGHVLHAGDGARIVDEPALSLKGAPEAEVLLFDLA